MLDKGFRLTISLLAVVGSLSWAGELRAGERVALADAVTQPSARPQGPRPRALPGAVQRRPVRRNGDDDEEPPLGNAQVGVLDRPGFDLAAHVGFALPMGEAVPGVQLGDGLSGAVPFGLELAARGSKNVALGLGFEFAPVTTKNCDPGANCSATDYRLNLEAIFTSRAGTPADFWLAVGVGYEWLELSESGNPDLELTGLDYVNVQVGGEIRGDRCGISPFVGVSLGSYTSASEGGVSGDVADPSFHAWLQFGLRGVVNL